MINNALKTEASTPIDALNLPEKSSILNLSFSEKIRYMDSIRIMYPELDEILSQMEYCQNSTALFDMPRCMRLTGPSGSGKTSIVKIHCNKYPDSETPYGKDKPILFSSIPCPAYIGGLPSKLLHDLGDPFYAKSMKITLQTQRLYYLMQACNVQLIILDEIQHLVDRNSSKLLRDSSDWFKELINETRIPIVFLGMPDSNKIFIENEQLANRVNYHKKLMNFNYGDTFFLFLKAFDRLLPLKSDSKLYDVECGMRIYLSTKGLMKRIHDLIIEAAIYALEVGAERISMPMLAQAHNTLYPSDAADNPFLPSYSIGKLEKKILKLQSDHF